MKTIITFISLLFCAASVSSQTNYYSTTKTFNESGYTYQCDVAESGSVTLYNINNRWTYVDQVYKSTGEYFIAPDHYYLKLFEDDTWTRSKRFSIVNNAFSAAEKQRVKGKGELFIIMCINSDTGKIDEVFFEFTNYIIDPYATIPVSVYRKIETELKSNVWYKPTAEGKKLNYIMYWWPQQPK